MRPCRRARSPKRAQMSALKMLADAGVNPDVIVQATKDGDAIFLENHAVTDDEKRRKGIA